MLSHHPVLLWHDVVTQNEDKIMTSLCLNMIYCIRFDVVYSQNDHKNMTTFCSLMHSVLNPIICVSTFHFMFVKRVCLTYFDKQNNTE